MIHTTTLQIRIGEQLISVSGVPTTMVDDRHSVLIHDAVHAERLALRAVISDVLAEDQPLPAGTVRFLRGTLGLRAKGLADALSVRPETVSRWEKGERPGRHILLLMRHLVQTALDRPATLPPLPAEAGRSRAPDRVVQFEAQPTR